MGAMYFLRVNWIASRISSTAVVTPVTFHSAICNWCGEALSPPGAHFETRLSDQVSPMVVHRHLISQK